VSGSAHSFTCARHIVGATDRVVADLNINLHTLNAKHIWITALIARRSDAVRTLEAGLARQLPCSRGAIVSATRRIISISDIVLYPSNAEVVGVAAGHRVRAHLGTAARAIETWRNLNFQTIVTVESRATAHRLTHACRIGSGERGIVSLPNSMPYA
jgi:hypothetical protein